MSGQPYRKRRREDSTQNVRFAEDDIQIDCQQLAQPLRAPTVKKEETRNVYEIHVSKFDPDMTTDEIASHIIANTSIQSADVFSVTISASQKNNSSKTHIAFKISTFKKEYYEQIMSERLWAPHYIAREFIPQKANATLRQDAWPRYQRKTDKGNRSHQTPSSSNRNHVRTNSRKNIFPSKSPRRFETPTQNRRQDVTETPKRPINRTPAKSNLTPRYNHYGQHVAQQPPAQYQYQYQQQQQQHPQYQRPQYLYTIPAQRNVSYAPRQPFFDQTASGIPTVRNQ